MPTLPRFARSFSAWFCLTLLASCISGRFDAATAGTMSPPLAAGADDGKVYYDTSKLTPKGKPESRRMVGYFTNWSKSRQGCACQVEDIDGSLLTHLNYAFAQVGAGEKSNPSFSLEPTDPQDLGEHGGFQQVTGLRHKYPALKVLLSVGGWAHNDPPKAWRFTTMAATAKYRHEFIESALSLLREYDFDGLDIDWEYPGSGERGGYSADRHNYVTLLAELQAAMQAEAKRSGKPELLLTIAAPSSLWFLSGFELDEIHPHVDWINLMAYDFYGPWSHQTGANAPLSADSTPGGTTFIAHSVDSYLDQHVPPDKIVLGIATYARSFAGVGSADYGVSSTAAGFGGRCTGDPGVLGYFELEPILQSGDYQVHWHDKTATPFAYNPSSRTFISYDDPKSVALKATFANEHHLGGAMFWALDLDDFKHGYPLLTAAKRALAAAP
ncbi:MAG TPA: glycoside hydrolase family 18 protein [Polyangiaceae bacterium]|nr:glycoside hydrolase family 18 protein [Polyangiaceae bacterium]